MMYSVLTSNIASKKESTWMCLECIRGLCEDFETNHMRGYNSSKKQPYITQHRTL